ncbi:fimbrial major subunit CsuA/B family protein [Enterobacteriales bacterium SAP-6]|uniref:Fimbrial major subunit CsuA/B family protein n=2 Tax=Acerihabitans arboris TaxID=2691583 RepID=A0A845SNY5_9GAMM|nr:fimbrial major subunit CsuA/B family protein [Acerihabitans arboris]
MLALYSGMLQALPTQTFQVSASVVAGCRIQGGGVLGTLDFGSLSGIDARPVNAAVVQSATFSMACTPGMTLMMNISGGNHFTATRNLQRLNGNDLIAYRLFTSASFTPVSEIPVNQAVPISYTDGEAIQFPIYGQLQLNGFNPAGTYADTLTVTLSW